MRVAKNLLFRRKDREASDAGCCHDDAISRIAVVLPWQGIGFFHDLQIDIRTPHGFISITSLNHARQCRLIVIRPRSARHASSAQLMTETQTTVSSAWSVAALLGVSFLGSDAAHMRQHVSSSTSEALLRVHVPIGFWQRRFRQIVDHGNTLLKTAKFRLIEPAFR